MSTLVVYAVMCFNTARHVVPPSNANNEGGDRKWEVGRKNGCEVEG